MLSHSYLYCRRALITAAMFAAAAPAGRGQLGLGLAPMRTEVRLDAGRAHSGTLTLTNESSDKVRVRAELLDFSLDADATPQFARELSSEAAYSCRSSLTLNPMEFEIGAGTTARVRYTLRAPAGATARSLHCAAGFTTLPPVTKAPGMGISMAVRIVAAFYATVGNVPVAGSIRDLRFEQVTTKTGSEQQAVLTLENTADVYFRPEGAVTILAADGRIAEVLDLPSVPVLPKRTQTLPLRLTKAIPPGTYVARVRIDYGAREIEEAEVRVTVPAGAGRQ